MKPFLAFVAIIAVALAESTARPQDQSSRSIDKGLAWLVSVQGKDGGWGQDGGETSYIRRGERMESNGNDVANTAVAALALWRSGKTQYRNNVDRAVEFVLKSVESSPAEGLAVTRITGSQIQRKLGPYIDTFFAARLLGEVEGSLPREQNVRLRAALEKCVRKIEANQMQDGSWNLSGGWAPILGTSMASQSLQLAKAKGLKVEQTKLDNVDRYSAKAAASNAPSSEAAGVSLYSRAQQLEQLTRTSDSRRRNEAEITNIARDMKKEGFVQGFGSMGGEEFFSYLNLSDSLKRAGGTQWKEWNDTMKTRLVKLQNDDGTWAGHHCITGRVAVTSAAILTILVERM